MEKRSLRIVFLGTPEFAVASLEALISSRHQVVAVITAPDKPAGRGKKLRGSAVKECAIKHEIPVLQPTNLKNSAFLDELASFEADIQIVVAFRMLPAAVWDMPPMGTVNLHGSLLPQYRGAAPIHWAVINGEKETGVSTFQLQHAIDTGNILLQKAFPIGENETTGEVHDKMMDIGATLLAETVDRLAEGSVQAQPQVLEGIESKHAPKLDKEMARVPWSNAAQMVHNHIRGFSPFPAAWTELENGEDRVSLKILGSKLSQNPNLKTGEISASKEGLFVGCGDGNSIEITALQMAGKRRMEVQDFLRGFQFSQRAYFR